MLSNDNVHFKPGSTLIFKALNLKFHIYNSNMVNKMSLLDGGLANSKTNHRK